MMRLADTRHGQGWSKYVNCRLALAFEGEWTEWYATARTGEVWML